MAATYSGVATNAAISVQDAIAYTNNEAEMLALFQDYSTAASWVKPAVRKGARKVAYRKTVFSSSEMGTYDKTKGYPDQGYTTTFVEKTVTQEKGDVLTIDSIDDESSLGRGIVGLYNQYVTDVRVPTMDKYIYSQVVNTSGVVAKSEAALTADTAEKAILTALTALKNRRIKIEKANYELRCTPEFVQLLTEKALNRGSITIGGIAFSYSADVKDVAHVRIIEVPSADLGTDVNFILAPTSAIAVTFLLDETVHHEKLPGHGTRKQTLDVGTVYDAWVEPGFEKMVYVHKVSA